MAPGSSTCRDVVDTRIASFDYDTTASNTEWRSSSSGKAAASSRGSLRTPFKDDVHELLECPVCMTMMYPPIYQVLLPSESDFTKRIFGGSISFTD